MNELRWSSTWKEDVVAATTDRPPMADDSRCMAAK
jgi:hypothetical protein